jgi:RIO kinase 2
MAMPISAEQVKSLHPYELRILLTLEHMMKRYAWVPLDLLQSSTGFSESELSYRLGRLMAWDMVRYRKVPYEGYALVFAGLDTLALRTLSERDTLKALGSPIGVGKESVVYEGLGLTRLVLKFHRVGQRSFQSARISRGYLPDEGHIPRIFASILSAEREFLALKTLHPKVRVPLPIDRNRHVVVMSLIEGVALNRARLPEPERTLEEILQNVRESYLQGVIHADLSEFNVLMEEGTCYLIDWPQWVETTHPNAAALLRRDVNNILTYFRRKYHIARSLDDILEEIAG